MTWKFKAISDPNLKYKDWMLLKIGPTTFKDMIKYYFIKFKYMTYQ